MRRNEFTLGATRESKDPSHFQLFTRDAISAISEAPSLRDLHLRYINLLGATTAYELHLLKGR